MKSVSYTDQLNYVAQRYLTINGVPVENVPRKQLGAIYYRMVNGPKKKPQTEYQITIDDILKGESTNG